jgi:hypothetical protein
MITKPVKPEEISVFRRFVPMIGLLAAWAFGLWAAPAHAQVNIDQGKSAAEIFSNDCGTCHKGAKGLANGKNSATLAGFLREHYTSSAQQAASLAAYVLGAGAGPPPSASLKPGTGEPKTGEAKTGEVRIGEPKAGEKPGTRPGRPEAPATAKLQQPADQDTKIEAEPAVEPSPAAPGRKPAGKREPRPVTASRGPRQEPETPPPAPQAAPVITPEAAPAPVATAPATTEPSNSETPATAVPPPAMPATASAPTAVPEQGPAPAPSAAMSGPEASPSAAAPAETPASDGEPVPRDDIPD